MLESVDYDMGKMVTAAKEELVYMLSVVSGSISEFGNIEEDAEDVLHALTVGW